MVSVYTYNQNIFVLFIPFVPLFSVLLVSFLHKQLYAPICFFFCIHFLCSFLCPLQLFIIHYSPTFTSHFSFISFYFLCCLFLFFIFFLSWFLSFKYYLFFSFYFFLFLLYPASTKVFTTIFFSLFAQLLATLMCLFSF